MINPFTDPPRLLLQALEDLGVIADVARRVPELEERVESIVAEFSDDLGAMRSGLGRLEAHVGTMSDKLDGLKEEMSPIAQLPGMRESVEPLDGRMQVMTDKLDGLREEMSPIAQLPGMRSSVEPLDGRMQVMTTKLDGLREEMAPIQELPQVREAIEPLGGQLGGKMDVLTRHVDDIEPMFKEIVDTINGLVPKIEEVREAISPLGDVIDNLPKFMKN
jgi:archaellum component FlaC